MRTFVVSMASALAGVAVFAAPSASPTQVVQQTGINQTSQPKPDLPKGTGFLMGVVVDASGKKPIGGAIVTITGGPPVSMTLPSGEVVQSSNQGTPDAPRQVLTGPDGQFLFRALNAGRYQIRSTAPGYIPSSYGQLRPTGTGQSIELVRDDERRGDLSIRLWKAATISGTITDENGEPVMSASVRLFRRTLVNGRPRLSSGASGQTDDRGMYRVPNLIPGDYLAAVMSTQTTFPVASAEAYRQEMAGGGSSLDSQMYRDLSSSGAPYPGSGGYRVDEFLLTPGASGRGGTDGMSPAPADDGRVLAYPNVFFPAARVAAQAGVITLSSGEDRGAIDMQLKLIPTVRVSGTVVGPDGPGKNLGLKLFPVGSDDFSSDSGLETAVTATDANGAFTFLGVAPGQYTLKSLRIPRATPSMQPSQGMAIEVSNGSGLIMGMSSGSSSTSVAQLPKDPTVWANMSVNVGEGDLTGVRVTLQPGVKISGRIVFEGTHERPPPDQIQRASISVSPVNGATNIQMAIYAGKRVELDGQFATTGYPPGKYLLSAFMPVIAPARGSPPVSWRFKSATLAGRDLSDDGLAIEDTEVSGIVLTFTDKSSDVTGNVTDSRGQPDRTASVIVIPADSEAWKQGAYNGRRLRSVRTSTIGAFSFTDLPAGPYFIAAVSEESLDNWQDPKAIEAIIRVATRFTLGDGEKLTQALTTRVLPGR